MWFFILVKYLHMLGIFLVTMSLFYQLKEVKPVINRQKLLALARVDALYGLGSVLVLVTGFTMWFATGKPADYYSNNFLFLTKLAVFTVIGILSAWPTVFFARRKKLENQENTAVPLLVRRLIVAEFLLLLLIPLLAVAMANGKGSM